MKRSKQGLITYQIDNEHCQIILVPQPEDCIDALLTEFAKLSGQGDAKLTREEYTFQDQVLAIGPDVNGNHTTIDKIIGTFYFADVDFPRKSRDTNFYKILGTFYTLVSNIAANQDYQIEFKEKSA